MITTDAPRENAPAVFELCGHWSGLLIYRLGPALADASYAWGDIELNPPSANGPVAPAQPAIPNATYEQLYS